MAALAAPAAPRHPAGLDGDRTGRPRLVCSMVVSAHHPCGLASVFAYQHERQLSAYGSDLLAPLDELYTTARDELARHRPGLYAQPGGLHVAGPLEEGYKDPWLLLTDLAPEASDAGWYGLRAWIEQGFKITKRA